MNKSKDHTFKRFVAPKAGTASGRRPSMQEDNYNSIETELNGNNLSSNFLSAGLSPSNIMMLQEGRNISSSSSGVSGCEDQRACNCQGHGKSQSKTAAVRTESNEVVQV